MNLSVRRPSDHRDHDDQLLRVDRPVQGYVVARRQVLDVQRSVAVRRAPLRTPGPTGRRRCPTP